MVFTSRGCRNHCPWCIVPKLEPKIIEYDDFPIPVGKNPWLGDNNLLGTSLKHQQLVVEKLKGVKNLDINSGFEAALFTEDSYQLYSQLDLECFRLAFDTMDDEADFTRAVKIIKKHGVAHRGISVYVLIGFPGTTYEDAVYRLEKARSLGCSPYPQRYQPLKSINPRGYVAPGFNGEQLTLLRGYWIEPRIWRSCTFAEYIKTLKSKKPDLSLLRIKFLNRLSNLFAECRQIHRRRERHPGHRNSLLPDSLTTHSDSCPDSRNGGIST